jgi:hypothetical protein
MLLWFVGSWFPKTVHVYVVSSCALMRASSTAWWYCIELRLTIALVRNCLHFLLHFRHSKPVVEAVLSRWHLLSCWWEGADATLDSKTMSLNVLTKLMILDATVVSNEQHSAYKSVWSMYCGLLTDKNTTLPFKVCALLMLRWVNACVKLVKLLVPASSSLSCNLLDSNGKIWLFLCLYSCAGFMMYSVILCS